MRLPFTRWIRLARTAPARPMPQRRRGQALVEFSLILVPFLLIIFGIIQMGLLFSTQLGLSTAARETARYASTLVTMNPTQISANGTAAAADMRGSKLPQYVIAYSDSNLVTTGSPSSAVTYCQYTNIGSPTIWSLRVRAQIEYRQVLLLPLISNIIDGFDGINDSKFRLGSREEMRVEGLGLKTNPGLASC
jgi:Flp pilus assembly protein TadG